MSGEQEDDLVDKACVYLLDSRYPDGCSGNTERIIRRKAATLVTRGGEVFYKKAIGRTLLERRYYNSCIVISNNIYIYIIYIVFLKHYRIAKSKIYHHDTI